MKTRRSFLVIILIFISTYDVTEATCAANEFTCDNGACIQSVYRCDDSFECDDRSDELNCPSEQPCVEGLHKCTSGECLADLNDCPSATSEIQTSTAAPPEQPSDDSFPPWIIGVIVGVCILMCIVVVLVVVYMRKPGAVAPTIASTT
ncbi:uncharacterized protein LOC143075944 [Mytilus galloprovincialis]|uniref:uncharacterized protein LOC143075944 n=1 Tax=Mytilus galloprovincialis TaxID=29158 RepID=UPI003F7C644C